MGRDSIVQIFGGSFEGSVVGLNVSCFVGCMWCGIEFVIYFF